jgi:Holliday junction resolvase RusA-like endonuclease
MTPLRFTVYGLPAGQGSKSIGRTRDGRAFVREDNRKVMPFRHAVAASARAAGARPTGAQMIVSVVWYMPRPASHLTAKGAIRKGAPLRPSVADNDKILRAVNDALEGIAWIRDRQVRPMACDCHFGDAARVEVTIWTCPPRGRWVYEHPPEEGGTQ